MYDSQRRDLNPTWNRPTDRLPTVGSDRADPLMTPGQEYRSGRFRNMGWNR